ncbi:2'-5' RNA ligase family protein [Myroides guanonis]|uniref:2'-5' RNA ligase n=1 Tax=Myroides guanonis TaxID=1150112 RepID=A0A1I3MQE7_9FLAO|nr:2'-5' RNA ligase family protein [Myroides guanonis]SFI99207.1 2'-5' RNA ligase [Myroides guanonis]
MIDKYSIVFQPNENLVELVRAMKLELAEEIGWYNSKNSLAHISIVEFKAQVDEISRIHKQITRCSERFKPVTIHFQSFGTYPNGALYLEVDTKSKEILKEYSLQLIEEFQIKLLEKSNDPHLSIARKLDEKKIEKALKLFSTPHITSEITNISLRKFNPIKKQYDIIHSYPLLNLGDNRDKQLELF